VSCAERSEIGKLSQNFRATTRSLILFSYYVIFEMGLHGKHHIGLFICCIIVGVLVILSFAWIGGIWGFLWGAVGLAGAICGAIAAFHVATRILTFFCILAMLILAVLAVIGIILSIITLNVPSLIVGIIWLVLVLLTAWFAFCCRERTLRW